MIYKPTGDCPHEEDVMVNCGGTERKKKEKKMPPDAFVCHPFVTSLVQIIPPLSPKSQLKLHLTHKYRRGSKRMKITKKKLIPVLVFILSSISILRLLKTSIITPFSSPLLPALPSAVLHACSSPSPTCTNYSSHVQGTPVSKHTSSANASVLTNMEFKLLSSLISGKAPCNLLVFGLEPQYLNLASINAGGYTIVLEDDPAGDAYELLKDARQNQACAPNSGPLEVSTCRLALTELPPEVYKLQWDVVVVDGPSGDRPEAPGRMAAIYTASRIARAGNTTHVVVHDIHRMIEKWFSWEFLCDENLVSSKGKLWNFRIKGKSNSTSFCADKTDVKE